MLCLQQPATSWCVQVKLSSSHKKLKTHLLTDHLLFVQRPHVPSRTILQAANGQLGLFPLVLCVIFTCLSITNGIEVTLVVTFWLSGAQFDMLLQFDIPSISSTQKTYGLPIRNKVLIYLTDNSLNVKTLTKYDFSYSYNTSGDAKRSHQ